MHQATVLRLSLAAAILLTCAGLRAQTTGETRVLPLGIYNSKGQLLHGLQPEQIQVKIQVKGMTARVRNVAPDLAPRRIVVLLDVSSSMQRAWRFTQRMTREILIALRPGDWVAVYVFAEKHSVLTPFTQDYEAAARAVEGLPEPGSKVARTTLGRHTWMASALQHAVDDSLKAKAFGDVVLLVTDGMATGDDDHRDWKLLRQTLATAGVRVFWLALLDEALTRGSPEEEVPLHAVRLLVEETGGATLVNVIERRRREPSQAPPLDILLSRIHHVYRVEIELDHPVPEPTRITLEVRDSRGKKVPPSHVSQPRWLLPNVSARQCHLSPLRGSLRATMSTSHPQR